MHVRSLATGDPIATVPIVEGAVLESDAMSGSGVAVGGDTAFVPHNDGAGVEVARVDVRAGTRIGADVAVPDSLGCTVAGAPLLTPVAADGARLLVFTVAGNCGPGLVRAVVRGSAVGAMVRTPVAGLAAGVPPAQVIIGTAPRFAFAVARAGGVDVIDADGAAAGGVELGETPAAIAAPETAGASTPAVIVAGSAHVFRLGQGADGVLRQTASVDGGGVAVAIAGAAEPRVAVAGPGGLAVLRSDLSVAGTAPGAYTAVSAGGDLAFAVRSGRLVAVGLDTPAVTDLGVAAAAAPALARGYVVTGPAALLTTDVAAPTVTLAGDLRRAEAQATDDRGVTGVVFRLGTRRLGKASAPPFVMTPHTRRVPPGTYTLDAAASDAAGNVGHATQSVTLTCHARRGTAGRDHLRGGRGRDCVTAGRGRDRVDVRGGGADAVRCGPGRDTVRADRFDQVTDDCEHIRRR